MTITVEATISDAVIEYRAERRERLAAYAHTVWCGWMDYLFSRCAEGPDGTMIIPAWAVERWRRQAHTDYADLPDREKASDRKEADKILDVVQYTVYSLPASDASDAMSAPPYSGCVTGPYEEPKKGTDR